ncbi:alpha-1,2-fucosyltransferase [Pseudooceanicola onchidii]|uniref:alpha-1,2-fucosyltransferase n=1 Tax=Pseudooceanicola onchidii TaxID=2562279 RepID=UPI0010AA88A8|nr:alpha-1,2-fucosyltransferase [Pseudooceanicola onchidii]
MIYTRFHGRTGNQMFQYAAARALALELCTRVVLDDRLAIARGERSITRIWDLPRTQAPMPPSKHDRKLAHYQWRYLGRSPKYVREKGLGFDPAFFSLPDDSYLHGYWQSEKYFGRHADQIRADFALPAPTGRNAELAEEIAAAPSVSLHVRRGDYVALAAHGVCDQAYYDAALAQLLPRLDAEPVIFVFSDEPDWARHHLTLPGRRVVIDHNGEDADYEDMRLMSLCDHNIIANSSFSWWGAWLNTNPDKIVVGPKDWFANPKLTNPDILPDGWLRA